MDKERPIKSRILSFIAKKADYFKNLQRDNKQNDFIPNEEELYSITPPIESLLRVPPEMCRQHFFESVDVGDVVVGVVSSLLSDGLMIKLICTNDRRCRDIKSLKIYAFCSQRDIPKIYSNSTNLDAYQPKDLVRGHVLSKVIEDEKVVVSLMPRTPDTFGSIKMGLISTDDLPVYYKSLKQMHNKSYEEFLQSSKHFYNPKCCLHLSKEIGLDLSQSRHTFLTALRTLEIPETDYADSLRKAQNMKMASKHLAEGVEHFRAKRYVEAIQCFNVALQIEPEYADALVARGALYANNDNYENAMDDFEAALRLEPTHSNGNNYLSQTLMEKAIKCHKTKSFEEAAKCYSRALGIEPDRKDVQIYLKFAQLKEPFPDISKIPDFTLTTDKETITSAIKRHIESTRETSLVAAETCETSSNHDDDRDLDIRSRSQDTSDDIVSNSTKLLQKLISEDETRSKARPRYHSKRIHRGKNSECNKSRDENRSDKDETRDSRKPGRSVDDNNVTLQSRLIGDSELSGLSYDRKRSKSKIVTYNTSTDDSSDEFCDKFKLNQSDSMELEKYGLNDDNTGTNKTSVQTELKSERREITSFNDDIRNKQYHDFSRRKSAEKLGVKQHRRSDLYHGCQGNDHSKIKEYRDDQYKHRVYDAKYDKDYQIVNNYSSSKSLNKRHPSSPTQSSSCKRPLSPSHKRPSSPRYQKPPSPTYKRPYPSPYKRPPSPHKQPSPSLTHKHHSLSSTYDRPTSPTHSPAYHRHSSSAHHVKKSRHHRNVDLKVYFPPQSKCPSDVPRPSRVKSGSKHSSFEHDQPSVESSLEESLEDMEAFLLSLKKRKKDGLTN